MKKPPFWRTYLVAAVAIGLGAYIYFVESKREPGDGDKKKEKVFTLDRAKAKAVTLGVSTGEEVKLVKEKDQWRMTAPMDVAADTREVDSLLTTVESLEQQDVVAETAGSVAEYGLEKPRLTVAVQQDGGAEARLQVGDKTPDGSALYAKVPDKPRIFTVPSYVESALDKKPFDFRDRDLLHVKREDVRTLAVTGPEGSYTLAREKGDEWSFTQPLATRAARWSVDSLLGNLESLRFESVASENATDLKPFGLVTPARTVTLGLASGEAKVLELGSATGEKKLYAKVSSRPLVAVIPGTLGEDLAKGMAELRAKRLLEVATYEVNGFDVETGGVKKVFERTTTKDSAGAETTKWKRVSPDPKELETNKVQDALFAVGGVEATEFVDAPGPAATYGLEPPTLKVTLRFEGGKPPATFEVGEKDGAFHARRGGDSSLLKLDPARAQDLLKPFREL